MSPTGRIFPDPKHCITEHFYGDVYQCKSSDRLACPHAEKVGFDHYCSHPDCPNFLKPGKG